MTYPTQAEIREGKHLHEAFDAAINPVISKHFDLFFDRAKADLVVANWMRARLARLDAPEPDGWQEAYEQLRRAAGGGNADRDNVYLLRWIADRLVNVYGESPNIDFVHALRERATMLEAALAAAPQPSPAPDGDARTLEQRSWAIVHEALPKWWNYYWRRFPNSKASERTLREEAAHACVMAALAAAPQPEAKPDPIPDIAAKCFQSGIDWARTHPVPSPPDADAQPEAEQCDNCDGTGKSHYFEETCRICSGTGLAGEPG